MSSTTRSGGRPRAFHPAMAAHTPPPTAPPGWDLGTERRIDDGETLATLMGWFSIGLGAAELMAPRQIAGWLGMGDQSWLIRAYGVREIGSGLGILNKRRPEAWVWARIAGDLLDLATLAAALAANDRKRDNVLTAMGAVGGALGADLLSAYQLRESRTHRIRPSDGTRAPLRQEVPR